MQNAVTITAVPGIPDIAPGHDLGTVLCAALQRAGTRLTNGDIVTVAHKIVSKAQGKIVRLADIVPGREAVRLAGELNKDARKIEVILRESKRIVRAIRHPGQAEGILIAEHRLGFVCANAAVDESNVGAADSVIVLPEDPDGSARDLCRAFERAFGVRLGVVITDTFGRPWRMGLVNVAVGSANVPAVVDLAGDRDAYGRPLSVTRPALADELAAASGLLSHKNAKTPVLVFRGVTWRANDTCAQQLIRPQQEDLFR